MFCSANPTSEFLLCSRPPYGVLHQWLNSREPRQPCLTGEKSLMGWCAADKLQGHCRSVRCPIAQVQSCRSSGFVSSRVPGVPEATPRASTGHAHAVLTPKQEKGAQLELGCAPHQGAPAGEGLFTRHLSVSIAAVMSAGVSPSRRARE